MAWEHSERQTQLVGHVASALAVAISPDGNTVLSGSKDCTAALWDTRTGKRRRAFAYDYPVTSVTFSPDGGTFCVGIGGGLVLLYDCATAEPVGKVLMAATPPRMRILALAISKSGSHALTGGEDGAVKLWELDRWARIRTFGGWFRDKHSTSVRTLGFSSDGNYAVSGGRDNTVRLWECGTGRQLRCFEGHSVDVCTVGFAPDSTLIYSVDSHGEFRFWDVATGRVSRVLDAPRTGRFEGIAACVSRDARLAIIADGGQELRIIDLERDQVLASAGLEFAWGAANAVAVDARIRYTVIAFADGGVRVFPTPSLWSRISS